VRTNYLMLLIATIVLSASGCVTQVDRDVQREFTYDFRIPGKSQNDLWRNARDYFAETYGDSRSVFRVMDEKDGTLIGRGVATWTLTGLEACYINYHIRFASKNEKARLQFELIEGALMPCKGWSWPTQDGYAQIINSFNRTAKDLESSLKGDNLNNKLKDF